MAKHIVFKDCLQFGDFSNFDSALIGYKRTTSVTFKLKTAVNVDELFNLQRLDS
jgi:hypothetical protein